IRQVADDAQIRSERGEIERERIAFMDGELARAEVAFQSRHDVAVDLHHVQRPGDTRKGSRDCGEAGTDLDHAVAGARCYGRDDARDRAFVNEEVLAETLARAVRVAQAASSAASSIAVRRLPTSPRPVPARSSAVPWSTDVRMMGS